MKLTAILRIKNGLPFITDCLVKLSELSDEIVILDNGSTDGTLEIYKSFPKIKIIIEASGYDEGRDQKMLLEAAKKRGVDWILFIDSDEIFENNLNRKVIEKYMASHYNQIYFRTSHFWGGEEYFRADKFFFHSILLPWRSMWRNREKDDSYFLMKKSHNGNIKNVKGPFYVSPYRIKHFGYCTEEQLLRKIDLYDKLDGKDFAEMKGLFDPHLNPINEVVRIKFREYKNPIMNFAYIIIYKYTCNLLLILLALKCKVFNGKQIEMRG